MEAALTPVVNVRQSVDRAVRAKERLDSRARVTYTRLVGDDTYSPRAKRPGRVDRRESHPRTYAYHEGLEFLQGLFCVRAE